MKKLKIWYFLFLLAQVNTAWSQTENYFVEDENVQNLETDEFLVSDKPDVMRAYSRLYLRDNNLNGNPLLIDDKKPELFFKLGDNIRVESLGTEPNLWSKLNLANEKNLGHWDFFRTQKNEDDEIEIISTNHLLFIGYKSAYRTSFSDLKPFSELFGKEDGEKHVKELLATKVKNSTQLHSETPEVKYVGDPSDPTADFHPWEVTKSTFIKVEGSNLGKEIRFVSHVQIAKVDNNVKKAARMAELETRMNLGADLTNESDLIKLADRIKALDAMEEGQDKKDLSHYIVVYARDFGSDFPVVNRSINIMKVYKIDNTNVVYSYGLSALNSKVAKRLQTTINEESNDPLNVKNFILKTIDQGFSGARKMLSEADKNKLTPQ